MISLSKALLLILYTNHIIFVDQQLLNIFVLFLITTSSKLKTQYHVSKNSQKQILLGHYFSVLGDSIPPKMQYQVWRALGIFPERLQDDFFPFLSVLYEANFLATKHSQNAMLYGRSHESVRQLFIYSDFKYYQSKFSFTLDKCIYLMCLLQWLKMNQHNRIVEV